jgi:hypothetical protein
MRHDGSNDAGASVADGLAEPRSAQWRPPYAALRRVTKQRAVGDTLAQEHHTGMPGLYCDPQFDAAALAEPFHEVGDKAS